MKELGAGGGGGGLSQHPSTFATIENVDSDRFEW